MTGLVELAKSAWRYELGLDQYKRAKEYWLYHQFGTADGYSSDEHIFDVQNWTVKHLLTLSEIALTAGILEQGKPAKAAVTVAVIEAVKYGLHRFSEYAKQNPTESNKKALEILRVIGMYKDPQAK